MRIWNRMWFAVAVSVCCILAWSVITHAEDGVASKPPVAEQPANNAPSEQPVEEVTPPAQAPTAATDQVTAEKSTEQWQNHRAAIALMRGLANDRGLIYRILASCGEHAAREYGRQDKELVHLKDAINETRMLGVAVSKEYSFFNGELFFWESTGVSTNQEIPLWRAELQTVAEQMGNGISEDVRFMERVLQQDTLLFSLRLGIVEGTEIPVMREIRETPPVDVDRTAIKACTQFTEDLRGFQNQRQIRREQFFVALSKYLSAKCVALEDQLKRQKAQQEATEATTPSASFSPAQEGAVKESETPK